MPTTPAEYAARVRAILKLTDPDLDTSIGGTPRKMIDAFSEVMSGASIDSHLLDYQYDLMAKSGPDLDEYVRQFGFTRYPAKRASGTVTFSRTTPTTTQISIPAGTQLMTGSSTPVVVATIVAAVLPEGDSSITVPVQAVVGGTSGNLAANAISLLATPIAGFTSYTNTTALTGGADGESDEQLRSRFRATIFRNHAGTEDLFLATALDDPDVVHANVLGASERHREQIEISANTGTATLVDARHVYPGSVVFGPNIDGGDILIPGVHYTSDDDNPPTITVIDPVTAPSGVYDLEFEYVPEASRNDPSNGVTNRVDIYVAGSRTEAATETTVFRTARAFNNTPGSPLYYQNFRRGDGTMPQVGNYLIDLAFGPVKELDNTITIGAVTYEEDNGDSSHDYHVVTDISRDGATYSGLSGIELIATANGATEAMPADGTVFSVGYVFNAVPRDVENAVRAWRLVTTDVRAHEGRTLLLNMHFAVILARGYTDDEVEVQVEAAINRYISTLGFGRTIQVSDILNIVSSVAGVDAVRFLTSSDDATEFAIQRVSPVGAIEETYATDVPGQIRRALDVSLKANEVAALNDVTLVVKAQNTFGAV